MMTVQTGHHADAGGGGYGNTSSTHLGDPPGAPVEGPPQDNNINNEIIADNNQRVEGAVVLQASSEASNTTDGSASQKKRVAGRQITKDDDGNDDDAGQPSSGGMPKADATTLSTRRIIRAKRPGTAGRNNKPAADATTTNVSAANPFARVNLSTNTAAAVTATANENGPKNSDTAINSTTNPSGGTSNDNSNPFANIFLKASNGNNKDNSTTESKSGLSVFGSGSGFLKSSNPTTSLFGGSTNISNGSISTNATSIATTSTPFVFGSGTSTSPSGTTGFTGPSWFSSATTGSTPFAFAAPAVTSNSNETTGKEDSSAAPTDSTTDKKEILPEHVDLSTGEEGEQLVIEVRVKTFKRVLEVSPACASSSSSAVDGKPTRDGSKDGTTPSVPPSSASAPKISGVPGGTENSTNANEKGETANDDSQTTANVTVKDEEEASNRDGSANGTSSTSIEAQAKDTAATATTATGKSLPAPMAWGWREVGTGPLRVLARSGVDSSSFSQCRLVQRRESTPNGPATKVIVNVNIWKETTIQRPSEKHVQITTMVVRCDEDGATPTAAAATVAVATPVPETYLFKLKLAADATNLYGKLEELVSQAKSFESISSCQQ